MTVAVTDDHASFGDAAGGGERMALALAALVAAEQRTGVRRAAALVSPVRAPVPSAAPSPVPSAVLAPAAEPVETRRPDPVSSRRDGVPRLPVHPALAALLPGGVLPAGGTLTVQGSTSLLLGLLAAASRAGAWTAFVGAPAVGMLAASDTGMVLERVGLVPAPGPDAPTVIAALLDGIDVVVVGPGAALLDADRRRLAARARERGSVLVSTVRWPGAHVTLDARGGTWWGADRGAGWLRRRTLSVLRTGRGAAARPVEIVVEVPVAVGGSAVGGPTAVGGPAPVPASAETSGAGRLRVVA
jgi:hypothetical protein